MLVGTVLSMFCVVVNLSGTDLTHFSIALLMLGVGWNFLFVGGTTLLTETYRVEEKAKTQAFNDFLMFATITAASASAGTLQYAFGWRTVNIGVTPVIAVVLISLIWLKRRRQSTVSALVSL